MRSLQPLRKRYEQRAVRRSQTGKVKMRVEESDVSGKLVIEAKGLGIADQYETKRPEKGDETYVTTFVR